MTKEELELLKKEAGKTPTAQMQEFLLGFEERQNRSSMISLVFTIIGAVASTVAAVTGLILLFQYVPDMKDFLHQKRPRQHLLISIFGG